MKFGTFFGTLGVCLFDTISPSYVGTFSLVPEDQCAGACICVGDQDVSDPNQEKNGKSTVSDNSRSDYTSNKSRLTYLWCHPENTHVYYFCGWEEFLPYSVTSMQSLTGIKT